MSGTKSSPVKATLTHTTIQKAKALGGGRLSLGLELAVREAKLEREPPSSGGEGVDPEVRSSRRAASREEQDESRRELFAHMRQPNGHG